MNALLPAVAIVLCAWLPVTRAQGRVSLDLDARQTAALEDLERRNPRMARRMQRALQWRRDDALIRLEEHARFLDELATAREVDPQKHRLMEEQQRMTLEARELVERYHAALGQERLALELELRAHLNAWFDLRQAVRAHQMDALAAELAGHRERLADDSEAGLEVWLKRIVEGGERAMERRLAAPEEDDLDVLAPAIVEIIGRFRPEIAEELGRLSVSDPARFREMLEGVVERHPDVVQLARRERASELDLHRDLRRSIRAAHRELIPLVRARRSLGLPVLPDDVRDKLRAVLAAERGLSGRHLDRASAELERQRALHSERAAQKNTIVEVQFDRLVGRGLYAW